MDLRPLKMVPAAVAATPAASSTARVRVVKLRPLKPYRPRQLLGSIRTSSSKRKDAVGGLGAICSLVEKLMYLHSMPAEGSIISRKGALLVYSSWWTGSRRSGRGQAASRQLAGVSKEAKKAAGCTELRCLELERH